MEKPKVKCKDCGCLAVLDQEYRLHEATDDLRTKAAFPCSQVRGDPFSGMVCSAGAYDLTGKDSDVKSSKGHVAFILNTVNTERECSKFMKWRLGFSPKEHIQMKNEEEAKEENRTWQKNVLNDIGTKYDGILKSNQNRNFWYTLISTGIGGLGGAVLTIILSYYFGINRQGNPVQVP
ncbi:MAG: hypothetical protein U0798_17720 [Gemmataceae bacterium]